ncbi:hypothetical protein BDY21DRAFT_121850 [Lineolata rhizophorae]|uniref:F-box domain-containing protein n=1 Tax=Lineolata rhizophorae TaxID=578093 RepID=A0A6A6NPJ8_9PEZI|nr:hypothetical protein BDY21DRAFT_121850 [Lineolata rhizophorae]
MNKLPAEIVLHIIGYLDEPAPSESRFSYEPSQAITTTASTHPAKQQQHPPLKSLSLVSWQFRHLTLPSLFAFLRLCLDDILALLLPPGLNVSSARLRARAANAAAAVALPADSPHPAPCPPPRSVLPHVSFLARNHLERHVKSVLLYTLTDWEDDHKRRPLETLRAYWDDTLAPLWERLFDAPGDPGGGSISPNGVVGPGRVDPGRIVVVCPPTMMSVLAETSPAALSADFWAFGKSLHYLEFRNDGPELKAGRKGLAGPKAGLGHSAGPGSQDATGIDNSAKPLMPANFVAPPPLPRPPPPNPGPHRRQRKTTALWNLRPWTHLSYNEGSAIRAYETYEYFSKVPPQILHFILLRIYANHGRPPPGIKKDASTASPQIRSLTYISIFPFSTHVNTLLAVLHQFPALRYLTVQLAPGPDADSLLDQPDRVGRAEFSDLWSELDRAYDHLQVYLGRVGRVVAQGAASARFESRDYRYSALTSPLDANFEALRRLGWVKSGPEAWAYAAGTGAEGEMGTRTGAEEGTVAPGGVVPGPAMLPVAS